MSLRYATVVAAALALGACAGQVGSAAPPPKHQAPPPDLTAKEAQATAVIAEINALDQRFERIVENWNEAQIALADSSKRLIASRADLRQARIRSRRADRRRAARLVEIYEQGEPNTIEVLIGVRHVDELLAGVDYVRSIANLDRRIADQARTARVRLTAVEHRLRVEQRVRRQAVRRLSASQERIASMLAERRNLLSSVETQIAAIQAREARKQAREAAAARARLAREARERAREQAAEQARAARVARSSSRTAPAATTAAPPPATRAEPAATAPTTTTATTATTAPGVTVPAANVTASTASTTTAPPTLQPAAPIPPTPTIDPTAADGLPVLGHPTAVAVALQYLGVKYRWGGESPKTGFDCSGLVAYVYAQLGIQLPHSAAAQYGLGAPVPRDDLQPGDLVFFNGLSHVGIYIGDGQMVHAPHPGDSVKISDITGDRYVGARRI